MAPHYSWKLVPDSDSDPEKVKNWIWIQIRIKAKMEALEARNRAAKERV
jgi:hypothetical protein